MGVVRRSEELVSISICAKMNVNKFNETVSMYCTDSTELLISGWSSRRRQNWTINLALVTYEEDDVEETQNVLGHGGPTAQTCRHLGFCFLFCFFHQKNYWTSKVKTQTSSSKCPKNILLTPSLNFYHVHKLIPTCSRFCGQLCGSPACYKPCVSSIDFECININV